MRTLSSKSRPDLIWLTHPDSGSHPGGPVRVGDTVSPNLLILFLAGLATMAVMAAIGVRAIVFRPSRARASSSQYGLLPKLAAGSALFYAGGACVVVAIALAIFR